jgi:hypothetical protein
MTPNETTFWKIVCSLLVIACIRVHSIGFLATSVVLYYLLLSVPQSDNSNVPTDYLTNHLVSARLATTEEENLTPDKAQPDKAQPDKEQPDKEQPDKEQPDRAQPEKVRNWRKADQQTESVSNTVFHTTRARQPTPEQRRRLMKALFLEMRN